MQLLPFRLGWALIFGLGLVWAAAGPAVAELPDAAACAAAGAVAEQQAGLPANLLVSVGLVESGRADPLTGQVAPWPWTVNVDGAGHYFDSKPDAEAFVRLAQSSGAVDVDVGCFQVSLLYHPDAFASLDAAFDPGSNANYAAAFLTQLKGQTGSWNTAIADYHSAQPDLGLPYQRRVLAAWHGIGHVPAGIGQGGIDQVAFAAPDPVVILLAPAARRVAVFTMDDPVAPSRPGLPRVISP